MLGILAAGMDGVERGLSPGDPVRQDPEELSQTERDDRGIERYPETLAEALDVFEDDDVLREALGNDLFDSYLTIKRAQWEEFNGSLTDWEMKNLRGPF